jgi:hypothetical protein
MGKGESFGSSGRGWPKGNKFYCELNFVCGYHGRNLERTKMRVGINMLNGSCILSHHARLWRPLVPCVHLLEILALITLSVSPHHLAIR